MGVIIGISESPEIETKNIKLSENTAFGQTGQSQSKFNIGANVAIGNIQNAISQKLNKSGFYELKAEQDLNWDLDSKEWHFLSDLYAIFESGFYPTFQQSVDAICNGDFQMDCSNNFIVLADQEIQLRTPSNIFIGAGELTIESVLGADIATFNPLGIEFNKPIYYNSTIALPPLPSANGDYKLCIKNGTAKYEII
ncbi:MAG: hypothetical protein LBS01_02305 [Prevotellaceae bacterium]|jgi:hypothetical protein|nr:hypothetical protein [Prevotellaceae bacterium]